MKIYRKFLMVILTVVLVILGACGSSDEQSTTISYEPEVNNVSENTDETKDSLNVDTEISEEKENDEQDEVTDQTINEEEKSTENNNNQTVAEKNEKQENIKTEPTTSTEQATLENTSENEKNPSENIQISSGEEAVQYLKQQIKEGKNDDISFGATETVDTDDYGSYYTIQLVDIPLRISGKTGTLGYYKVYQDGTYELY